MLMASVARVEAGRHIRCRRNRRRGGCGIRLSLGRRGAAHRPRPRPSGRANPKVPFRRQQDFRLKIDEPGRSRGKPWHAPVSQGAGCAIGRRVRAGAEQSGLAEQVGRRSSRHGRRGPGRAFCPRPAPAHATTRSRCASLGNRAARLYSSSRNASCARRDQRVAAMLVSFAARAHPPRTDDAATACRPSAARSQARRRGPPKEEGAKADITTRALRQRRFRATSANPTGDHTLRWGARHGRGKNPRWWTSKEMIAAFPAVMDDALPRGVRRPRRRLPGRARPCPPGKSLPKPQTWADREGFGRGIHGRRVRRMMTAVPILPGGDDRPRALVAVQGAATSSGLPPQTAETSATHQARRDWRGPGTVRNELDGVRQLHRDQRKWGGQAGPSMKCEGHSRRWRDPACS